MARWLAVRFRRWRLRGAVLRLDARDEAREFAVAAVHHCAVWKANDRVLLPGLADVVGEFL
jgi:hypothetical protein